MAGSCESCVLLVVRHFFRTRRHRIHSWQLQETPRTPGSRVDSLSSATLEGSLPDLLSCYSPSPVSPRPKLACVVKNSRHFFHFQVVLEDFPLVKSTCKVGDPPSPRPEAVPPQLWTIVSDEPWYTHQFTKWRQLPAKCGKEGRARGCRAQQWAITCRLLLPSSPILSTYKHSQSTSLLDHIFWRSIKKKVVTW